MARDPASPQHRTTDRNTVDEALLTLARLLGEAAAAETRAETTEHEDAANDPQEDP